jgi:serine/threonine protein kinase/tetratricopeptide (TPR) repeat protein
MADGDLQRRARERLGTWLNGKYRLDGLLGIGGMAAVYRATHRNRAQLAVKVLHAQLALDHEVLSRFLREPYAANSVQHPGVVAVVDNDMTEDGTAFLVMELLDGMNVEELSGHLSRRVDLAVAVAIVHQLLDVLAAAHDAGVVHRDVKPANLFVTRDGTVKVLDFGVARVLETTRAEAKVTGAGMPVGTPAFMAPEQALARSGEIGPRTDIWSAGATLFTLLGGTIVHKSPTAAETLVHAATRPAPSLGQIAPDVPPSIVGVVDRALAFDAELRWPNAPAMAVALSDAFEQASGAPPSKATLAALFPPRSSRIPPPMDSSRVLSDFASAPTLGASVPPPRATSPNERTSPTPLSSSRAPFGPTQRRRARVAIIAVSVLGLAVSGGVWRRARSRGHTEVDPVPTASTPVAPVPAKGPPLVLILGFENRTTDPVFDGTPELVLESSLKRSTLIYPLAGSGVRGWITEVSPQTKPSDEELGRLVAERTGRPVLTVRGTVAYDSGYLLSFRALDGRSAREVLASSLRVDTAPRVLPTVAGFADAIRTALGDPPPPEDREKFGLSASVEADHEYAQGRSELNTGKNALAISHFQRAIEVDPGFAVAQGALGVSLINAGRPSEAEAHLRESVRSGGDISKRERLLNEAVYDLAKGELEECVAAYEALLAVWPAEVLYEGNLAAAYFAKGDFVRGRDLARRVVQERPWSNIGRSNLVGLDLMTGDFAGAAEETRAALHISSHPLAQTYAWGALAVAMLGRRDEAVDFHRRLKEMDPSAGATAEADFAAFEGRLGDAASALEAGISAAEGRKATEEADADWAVLGEIRLRQGSTAAARIAAIHAAASSELVTLYRAAHVLIAAGRPTEAMPLAEKVSKRSGDLARLLSLLLGAETLRANGEARKAIVALETAERASDSWIIHAELAETHFGLGAFADAERELEACLARRGEGLIAFRDDAVTARYVPPLLYQLARAKEALHRLDADESHNMFLGMEPHSQDDPLVADARRRLGR